MMLLDVALGVVLLVSLLLGIRVGLVATVGAILGMLGGGLASVWLVPMAAEPLAGHPLRGPTLVALVFVLLVVGWAAGTGIAARVTEGVDEHPLRWVNRLLGGALNFLVTVLVLSLVGSTIIGAGVPRLSSAVATSEVLRRIEMLTPAPVGHAMARLETMVRDDALPAVGGVLWDEEQAPLISVVTPPAPMDTGDPEVTASLSSVARILATSHLCAKGSVGSGFVVGDGLVMTNAHVVAGAEEVVVELPQRPAANARVVYFDEVKDIAVLAIDGGVAGAHGAPVLRVGPDLEAGASAIVAGYPGGGPMVTSPAGVMGVGNVVFQEASEAAPVDRETAPRREAYRLHTQVAPGNSGGPVIADDGSVAGMVFASDSDEAGYAWALTSDEVAAALAAVPAGGAPVPVGACR